MSRTSWAGMGMLALKVGPKLLKSMKALKSLKALGAVGSVAAYTWLFSWQMAIAIIVLLFVHEYGHIWAMKKEGMKVKGIYFIPFLGGAAVPDEMFNSRRQESFVAIMGPVFGLGLTLIVLIIHFITGQEMYAGIAAWMALINAFQLLPINPMDGGRIVKSIVMSIQEKIGIVVVISGFALAAYLLIKLHIWLFVIMIPIGLLEFFLELKFGRKAPKQITTELERNLWLLYQNRMTTKQILIYAVVTIAVLGSLFGGMFFAQSIPGAKEALMVIM